MKKARCGDCDVEEGEIHQFNCDMEVCPFCGNQLLMCNLSDGEGSDKYVMSDKAPTIYSISRDETKARIPYIEYPVLCAKCGKKYPDFFHVSDEEWEQYIQPDRRHEVICRECYDYIKSVIDS